MTEDFNSSYPLSWDSGGDERHELINGVPIAMSPTLRAHRLIAGNLYRRISEALDHRPPCVVEQEAGILSHTSESSWFVADLAVTCREHEAEQRETPDPLLIVEILSPSTESHDRKVKLIEYRELSSVEEVLLVDRARLYAEVHRRHEGLWVTELIHGPEATIRLESIDLELPLIEVYLKVDLEPEGHE